MTLSLSFELVARTINHGALNDVELHHSNDEAPKHLEIHHLTNDLQLLCSNDGFGDPLVK